MIVAMPTGIAHGWGIAGQHLIEGIYGLPPVPDVTLHSMNNPDFAPSFPDAWNKVNIGYCFFENDIEAYLHLKKAVETWDFIVAGSHWCEYHLRLWGVQNTATILQGVDGNDFFALPPRRDDGRFVVFSGGKFELRKSQDVVIAAMKVFMDRHDDVWLSAAWHNQWPFSVATMAGSPHIRFEMQEAECQTIVARTLQQNGLDLSRVTLHPMMPNSRMRDVYEASDIGLFPNRCEGGNNMVMSEYMACGRAVIASNKTGHADVVSDRNAFELYDYEMKVVERNDQPSALWFEPSVDEVIERLEYAYSHRDTVATKSLQAAADLKRLDWGEASRQFHVIATGCAPNARSVTADDYLFRADGLVKASRPDLAVLQLLEALHVAPLNVAVHAGLANLFTAIGRDREAMFHQQKAEMLNNFTRK